MPIREPCAQGASDTQEWLTGPHWHLSPLVQDVGSVPGEAQQARGNPGFLGVLAEVPEAA